MEKKDTTTGFTEDPTSHGSAAEQDLPSPSGEFNAPAASSPPVPYFDVGYRLVTDRGIAYLAYRDSNENVHVWPLSGQVVHLRLRAELTKRGEIPTKRKVSEVIELLSAQAFESGSKEPVWQRVAPLGGSVGVELDAGDDAGTRIRVTDTRVEVLTQGSRTLLARTDTMLPYPALAEHGDLPRLRRYVNVSEPDYVLLLAFITYVLMHPKQEGVVFPILALLGDQGTGKSVLSKLILMPFMDPSMLGIQLFPTNITDLVIGLQQGHARYFDNVRSISPPMSDALCVTSTGGTLVVRQLFTNSGVNMQNVHGALVLNGIYQFVGQSDLAQRCLTMQLQRIPEEQRQSEPEMLKQLQEDRPAIFRGLLEYCSEILRHLPAAKVTHATRIYELSRWLAAMELVDDKDVGTYQRLYSNMLKEGQLDSLYEHPLAEALIKFISAQPGQRWSGQPDELLTELECFANNRTVYSNDWPRGASSFTKRLKPLAAAFRSQGVEINFGRGKYRTITVVATQELIHDDRY